MSKVEEKFDCWAVVEVMGHNRYAGRVTGQAIGGCAFVRVDVPAVGESPAFTNLLGRASIFAITPCSEDVARRAAAQCYCKPVEIYDPIPARIGHEEPDQDDDWSDED